MARDRARAGPQARCSRSGRCSRSSARRRAPGCSRRSTRGVTSRSSAASAARCARDRAAAPGRGRLPARDAAPDLIESRFATFRKAAPPDRAGFAARRLPPSAHPGKATSLHARVSRRPLSGRHEAARQTTDRAAGHPRRAPRRSRRDRAPAATSPRPATIASRRRPRSRWARSPSATGAALPSSSRRLAPRTSASPESRGRRSRASSRSNEPKLCLRSRTRTVEPGDRRLARSRNAVRADLLDQAVSSSRSTSVAHLREGEDDAPLAELIDELAQRLATPEVDVVDARPQHDPARWILAAGEREHLLAQTLGIRVEDAGAEAVDPEAGLGSHARCRLRPSDVTAFVQASGRRRSGA